MRSMVNKISAFIRNLPFIPRLSVSIGIAIVLFISITAFQWSGYKAGWNTAVKNYVAEIKAREEAIVKIEAEAKASEEKKVQEAEMCKKHLKEHNLMAALNECHDEQNSITPKISIPYPPVKVEPFWKYNFNEHLAPVAGDSIAFAIALFVLLTIISQYQNEKSFGWKRLSLVLSALISMLIHFYLYDDYSYRSVIVSYPISVLTLLYAKIIYCWIKDGFTLDRGPSNSKVMQSPIAKNQSIQDQEKQSETDAFQETAGASITLKSSHLDIPQNSVERTKTIQSITQLMQRLYSGEVQLVYTYWVFGVVVGNVVPLILLGFLGLVNEPPLFILIISIIALLAWIWFISVAIWRSAINYNKVRLGSIWADLAKVSVFLGIASIVMRFVFEVLSRIQY
jgi:hypothetical protein